MKTRNLLLACLLAPLSIPAIAKSRANLSSTTIEAGFAKISALAGAWTGINEQGQPEAVSYEAVSNNMAVRESYFGMTTMYTVDQNSLLATHYCSMGNQPRMRATEKTMTSDSIKFDFFDLGNDDGTGNHIDSVKFVFAGDNTFAQTWTHRTDHVTGTPFSMSYVRDDSHAISTQTIKATQIAVTKRSVPVEKLTDELSKALANVKSVLALQNPAWTGVAFARFEEFGAEVKFSAGYAFDGEAFHSSDVVTETLPAGQVALSHYNQKNEDPSQTYSALHNWMTEHNVGPAGAPWELYTDSESPLSGRTIVVYPFK